MKQFLQYSREISRTSKQRMGEDTKFLYAIILATAALPLKAATRKKFQSAIDAAFKDLKS